jgi:glycosyltransferase involved in cell wall biosynthesis
LISIVIPCHNRAAYLARAIESALAQTYVNHEVVVIDDGSSDATAAVAARYLAVRSLRQSHQGLAAARNAGIDASKGELLVFLDADDRLLPKALELGLDCFREHPESAFIFGGYRTIYADTSLPGKVHVPKLARDFYLELLTRNCVEMHATALFRRTALLSEGKYDGTLKAAEDYDLCLRLARHFPISCHNGVIAEYWIHEANMSRNSGLMLRECLRALRKQQNVLDSSERRKAFRTGLRQWQDYYGRYQWVAVRHSLKKKHLVHALRGGAVLCRYAPRVFITQVLKQSRRTTRSVAKKVLPRSVWRVAKAALRRPFPPDVGQTRFGDLRSTIPIDRDFGFSRGTPIDRYYIEGFLSRQAADIRGRVLEIGDDTYTRLFGADRVEQSDVLHLHEGQPSATFVADLTDAPQLPSDAFDCFILTQTLHLIYDFRSALRTSYRTLRPGGVLLMTTPGITKIGDAEWNRTWHWSFTHLSVRRLLEELFPSSNVEVCVFGNVLAAIAFLEGLSVKELQPRELDEEDEDFQVIIAARAVKPRPPL